MKFLNYLYIFFFSSVAFIGIQEVYAESDSKISTNSCAEINRSAPFFKPSTGSYLLTRTIKIKSYQSMMSKDLKGPSTSTDSTNQFRGTLNRKVLDISKDTAFVGFQLSNVIVTLNGKRVPSLEMLYRTFFIVAYDLSGMPVRFHFPKGLTKQNRSILKELIYTLQWHLPEGIETGTTGKEWDKLEPYTTQDYLADYSFSPADCIFTKKKSRFLGSKDAKEEMGKHLSIVPSVSAFTATFNKTNGWFADFKGAEVLEIKMKDVPIAVSSSEISLKEAELTQDEKLELWKIAGNIATVIRKLENTKTDSTYSADDVWIEIKKDQLKKKYKNTSLIDLVKKADEHSGVDSRFELFQALDEIEQYFLVFPERISQIPEIVLKGKLKKVTSQKLICKALSHDNPQGQQILISIIQDVKQSEIVRRQAITCSRNLKKPNALLISETWDFICGSKSLKQCKPQKTRETYLSLFVIGALSFKLNTAGEFARADEINRRLIQLLQQTDDERLKDVLLKALYNTQNKSNYEIIKPYLSSPNHRIRNTVVRILPLYDEEEVLGLIIDRMKNDENPGVRGRAFRSLKVKNPPDILSIVENCRKSEKDEHLLKKYDEYLLQVKQTKSVKGN